jgi:two-component system sensor histidine kinase RegB
LIVAAFDRTAPSGWQGGGSADPGGGRLWDWAEARRGLRLRTLVLIRWAAIAGQTAAVLVTHFLLGYELPWISCLLVIAAGALANIAIGLAWPGTRIFAKREAMVQLGFDLVQVSLLLGLTGGLQNPFALLLLAPPTVAAATLRFREAMLLVGLALLACLALFFWSAPLPWRPGEAFTLPDQFKIALLVGEACGVVFTAAYAWQASAEAARMELALAATPAVLSREQRLSALGGLAAAAAHELGTPLATIQVVAKEMMRGAPPGPLAEDLQLLVGQAERCRDILKKLSRQPDTADAQHARMSLSQLLEEVSEPHRGGEILISTEVTCDPGASILEVKRQPEVLHALQAFVENAADYAEASVEVTAHYGENDLSIEVRDDGPGFAPEVIARLGEPYVTTRSQGEGSRSDHHGMGLGFFIAKTLLERTGARVQFRNARTGGAIVVAHWRRAAVEAPPESF